MGFYYVVIKRDGDNKMTINLKAKTGEQILEKIKKNCFTWLIILFFGTSSFIITFILGMFIQKYPNFPLLNISRIFFGIFLFSYYVLLVVFSTYLISQLIENFKKFVKIYLIIIAILSFIGLIWVVYHFFHMRGIVYGIGILVITTLSRFFSKLLYAGYQKWKKEKAKKQIRTT